LPWTPAFFADPLADGGGPSVTGKKKLLRGRGMAG